MSRKREPRASTIAHQRGAIIRVACYYRALGFGLRDEFSDVLKGTKTVEELMDYPAQEENQRVRRQPKIVQPVPEEKKANIAAPAQTGNPAPHNAGEKVQAAHQDPLVASVERNNGASPLDKVRRRLAESQIAELEFLDVLKFSKLPEAQNVSSLSDVPTRLLVMAIEGWPTVEEIAGELREREAERK